MVINCQDNWPPGFSTFSEQEETNMSASPRYQARIRNRKAYLEFALKEAILSSIDSVVPRLKRNLKYRLVNRILPHIFVALTRSKYFLPGRSGNPKLPGVQLDLFD